MCSAYSQTSETFKTLLLLSLRQAAVMNELGVRTDELGEALNVTISLQNDSSQETVCNHKTASDIPKGRMGRLKPDRPTVTKLQKVNHRYEWVHETYSHRNKDPNAVKKAKQQLESCRPERKVYTVIPILKSANTKSEGPYVAEHVSENTWKKEVSKINTGICKTVVYSCNNSNMEIEADQRDSFTDVNALNTVTIHPLEKGVSNTVITTDENIAPDHSEKDSDSVNIVKCKGKDSDGEKVIEEYNASEDDIQTVLAGNNDHNDHVEDNDIATNIDLSADISNNITAGEHTLKNDNKRSKSRKNFRGLSPKDRERDSEYAQILFDLSKGKGPVQENEIKNHLRIVETETVDNVKEMCTSQENSGKDYTGIVSTNVAINVSKDTSDSPRVIEMDTVTEYSAETFNKEIVDYANSNESGRSKSHCCFRNEEETVRSSEKTHQNVGVNTEYKRPYRVISKNAKIHAREAEVCFAQVGKSARIWTQEHPQIKGIYLNKGKRQVKRELVELRREATAIDRGSYMRNGLINDKNRIDDGFVFTAIGERRRDLFEEGKVRDEYVVNWYMWCPGHGNCKRKCGEFGKCQEGMFCFFNIVSSICFYFK